MTFSVKRAQAMFVVQMQELSRDFGTLFLNFAFPALFVVILLFQHFATPTFSLDIGIVEAERSQNSASFVGVLADNPSVKLSMLASPTAARKAVADGDIAVAFNIKNADFSNDAGVIEVIASDRYQQFARLLLDAVRDRMGSRRQPQGATAPRLFDYSVVSPPGQQQSETTFQFPGLLALALVQLGLFATAVPLMQARDRGTLRYLSLTPLSTLEMLIGQLGMRAAVAFVQIILIMAVGSFIMDLSLGQWLLTLAVSVAGILLMVSTGYAIAGMVTNLQVGMGVILLSNFAMIAGGNIFLDAKASTFQYIAACLLPISYLADLYRQIILNESGTWPIWIDLLGVGAGTLLAITVALWTFKFDEGSANAGRLRKLAL